MEFQDTIKIYKKSEVLLELHVNDIDTIKDLRNFFSAKPEGYQFMPKFRSGMWKGTIYYIKGNILPIGLLDKLYQFAEKFNYQLIQTFSDSFKLKKPTFETFVDTLQLPHVPRDYQLKAAYDAICNKRLSIKANTSAGKSLIMYIISKFMMLDNHKMLIVVPTTTLVDQLYSDYMDYGWTDLSDSVSKIYGGLEKDFSKSITITTWQSLFTRKKNSKGTMDTKVRSKAIFKQFDCVMLDEAHIGSGLSVTKIMNRCENAQWRIGLSGTLPDEGTTDWFCIVGSLGPITQYTTYKQLRDNNQIAHLKMVNIRIMHDQETCKLNHDDNYKDFFGETDFINGMELRNQFITKLALSFKSNSIIMFTRKEHGHDLLDMLEETNVDTERRIFYVDGDTNTKDRTAIIKEMETSGINDVLVASYGTFSTGINLKNLHQIIAASNYKKLVKVVQSIGRLLRKMQGKNDVTMYNVIDDLSYKGWINYSVLHYNERKKIYKSEGYDDIIEKPLYLTN